MADHWLEFSTGSPIPVIPSFVSSVYPPINWDYAQNFPYNYFFGTSVNATSISDKYGNLIFYANGETIYHKGLDTLYTTGNINVDRVEAYQSLFIPKPGNSNRYFYITPPCDYLPLGVNYTELDKTLNAGLGGIVGNPYTYLMGPTCSKVTATYHANGKDIWVMTHEINSNNFKAFLVTKDGFSPNPVISSIGVNYVVNLAQAWHRDDPSAGQMKFSPSGEKLVTCVNGINVVQVFNFNKSTGILSDVISIPFYQPTYCEFSSDGTIAYIGHGTVSVSGSTTLSTSQHLDTNAVYQINLLAGNETQIANSLYKVNPNNDNRIEFNSMQLTYDGNIYVIDDSYGDRYKLNKIISPNVAGPGCNFIQYAEVFPYYQSIPIHQFRPLPSFFPSYLDRNILFANTCLNDSVLICTQTNTNFDSIRWEFNDPLLGLISIPNQDTIYHQFPGFGPYEISLKRYRNAGNLDVTKKLLFIYPQANILLPDDTLICHGETVSFTALADSCEFSWLNDFSTDTLFSPSITITQAGKYWPIISNFDNVCGVLDTIEVHYLPDNLNLGPDSFNLCSTTGYLLDASVNDSLATYQWSSGSTDSSLFVNWDGPVWVSVQQGNCLFQDTVYLSFDDPLNPSLPDSVTLCDGSGLWISAGDFNASYSWSPGGQTTSQIYIDSAGLYTVTVSNGCGDFIDSTLYIQPEIPTIDLGPDTSLCQGSSLIIDASFPHSNFNWSNGSTASSIQTLQAGTYAVTVSNICGTDSDTLSVVIEYPNSVYLGADTVVCLADNFVLSTGSVQGEILWSNGFSGSEINIIQSGSYSVSVTNACGLVADTLNIEVIDVPYNELPADTHICQNAFIVLSVLSPQATYQWSTGSGNASIVVNDPDYYWVTVTNICGISIDSIEVISDDTLWIDLGQDTALCIESNFMLQSSMPANQYLWSNGESAASILIQASGEYWLHASNACNSSSDSIYVSVYQNEFAFSQDTLSMDSLQLILLEAPLGYQSYLWSTNATSHFIEISTPGEYWLMVSDSFGCTATDSIYILPYIQAQEYPWDHLTIYPNPNKGELFIEGLRGKEEIELFDFLGKSLITIKVQQNIIILNLNTYPAGIYHLIIRTTEQERFVCKVVRL